MFAAPPCPATGPRLMHSPRIPTAVAALLVVFAWSVTAHAQDQEPVYGWTDDGPSDADLDNWNPDIHEAPWFETWDFWMWADDGTFVLVQFVTSSFGFGVERNGSGRLIVVSPGASNDGTVREGVALGDRGWDWETDDWGWDEAPLDLWFRDCHLRGDGESFELRMRGRDHLAVLEVTFRLDEPLFRPGDGRLEYGWDRHHFFEQEVMPRFSFSGRVNRKAHRDDPDAWTELSGVGYGEHTLTNDFPFEIAAAFQGFRALRDDGLSIVFDGLTTPIDHGGRSLGWATVALDGEPVFESYDVVMAAGDVRPYDAGGTPYRVPWGYEIRASSGDDWMHVVVHDAELVSAESPFARIGALLRSVLGAMMAPYDFELAVDYDAWIHVGGHTAYVSGRGWSTMNFTR